MKTKELRNYISSYFLNKFDCYADTVEPSCIPAMTNSTFVEVVERILNELNDKEICLERKLHNYPTKFIHVVENALNKAYYIDMAKWNVLYDFYEKRYLNSNSPEKDNFKYGYKSL